MQMSKKAKRMDLCHRRGKAPVGLNLVSLMDIFTILVFFLLVNSSDVEVLPNAKDLELPASVAEQRARENVVVMVTRDDILVQGRVVSSTQDALAAKGMVIPELEAALREQARRIVRADDEDSTSREVTIMGDKGLPYSVLKRVMASCTAAEYGRISLAVERRDGAAPRMASANTAGG
jgi:biopolymer transport protein ExbD